MKKSVSEEAAALKTAAEKDVTERAAIVAKKLLPS